MLEREPAKIVQSPVSRRSNVSFHRTSQNVFTRQSFLDIDFDEPKEIKTLMDLEFFKMIQNFLGEKGVNKHTKNMRLGSFRRDQFIIKSEKCTDVVYVIMRGEVDVTDPLTGNVQTFSEGLAFGDLRFKGKGFKHIIAQAMTDCMIYLIDREDYFILMQEIEIEKINRFTFYLRSFEVFQNVHKSILEKIYLLKSDVNFYKNDVVFREGDDADGIYFIHKGEFLITKKVSGEQNKLREVERQVEILKKENELLVAGLIGKYNTKSSFFKQATNHLELKRTISEANNSNFNSKHNAVSNPSRSYEVKHS
jgi:CRP-like cAMP-binding protein